MTPVNTSARASDSTQSEALNPAVDKSQRAPIILCAIARRATPRGACETARGASNRERVQRVYCVARSRTPPRARAHRSPKFRRARGVDVDTGRRATERARGRERGERAARVMPCPFASRARATEEEDLTEVIITDSGGTEEVRATTTMRRTDAGRFWLCSRSSRCV